MHRRSAVAATACLLALGGLTACGSDDKAGPATTTAPPITAPPATAAGLTKAEFLTKGNAICTAGNAKLEAAGAKLGDNPTPAQIKAFADDVFIPNITKQIADLRALGIPSADKATVEPIFTEVEGQLAKAKSDPSTLDNLDAAFAAPNKKLTAYGLTVCGQS